MISFCMIGMSLHNFLCTPFAEVLTFPILWILIEPEPVEICKIKSYSIKSTLSVTALYFEDLSLVFDQH